MRDWGFLLLLCFSFTFYAEESSGHEFCRRSLAQMIQDASKSQPDIPIEEIRIAGVTIAETPDGKFLVGFRIGAGSNEVGTWGFAGGKMEVFDADIYEAAKREFEEEAGLQIPVDRFQAVGVVDYHGPDSLYYLSFYFRVILGADEIPSIPESEVSKIGAWQFFSLDELPESLFSATRTVLEAIKKDRSLLLSSFRLRVDQSGQ